MKISRRLVVLGLLFLIINMIVATQYVITKVEYEYNLVHPSNADIRYIGSDNSSDGIRILRVNGDNSTMVSVKLRLGGNFSVNQKKTYTASFGIVNEELHAVNITYINISSTNWSYLKIWLHGDRDVNAENISLDPSSVYMFNNGTIVNATNTTAWTLAAGDQNPNTMCYNISDRTNCSINTTWDEIAHVRYSINDTNAVTNQSDFVWVQITIDIGEVADYLGPHTGTIYVHLETETD
jgi:hypothetical protein